LLASWFLREDKEFGFFDKLFFGYGLGLGLLSYSMFILGVFGVPYTIITITSVQGFFALILLYLIYTGGGIKDVVFPGGLRIAAWTEVFKGLHGWKVYLCAFLAIWLFLKMGIVFYECIERPIYAWDMWANWSAGAKLFFFEKGLVLDQTDENFFGKGYRSYIWYPLHSPLLQVWISLWLEEFHEVYVKAWAAFYFISLLGVFFLSVKRESTFFYGIISVFFLSTAPLLTYHGMEGYSDLPLSYYGLASVVCFWRYLSEGKKGPLVLSGIFLAMGATTKDEGLFFFVAVGGALFLFSIVEKRSLSALVWFLLPFLFVSGPWFLFKALYGFGFGHGNLQSAIAGSKIHWAVLGVVFKKIFFETNFNLIFPFWLVLTVVGFRTVLLTNIKYLFFIIGTVMGMFIFIYLKVEQDVVTELTALHRNTLIYVPIIFFASAVVLTRLWPPQELNESGG
jgi:hypothetical protein